MTTLTLLEKLYADFSTKTVEAWVQSLCEGLKVAVQISGTTERGWIRIEVSGEDEVAALNMLEKEFGFAPSDTTNVKEGSVYRGKMISTHKTEVHVDFGAFLPSPTDAVIPLQHLQAELVDGRNMPLQQIAKLFCLLENLPLEVLIRQKDPLRKRFLAELSEKQISQFGTWMQSSLDRLVILGALPSEVEDAVRASGHSRDVVETESLGMLEHTVVCKLGTDAAGLIPKIGRRLPATVLGVFSPKEIRRYVAF